MNVVKKPNYHQSGWSTANRGPLDLIDYGTFPESHGEEVSLYTKNTCINVVTLLIAFLTAEI